MGQRIFEYARVYSIDLDRHQIELQLFLVRILQKNRGAFPFSINQKAAEKRG